MSSTIARNLEAKTLALLFKFHKETECGEEGMHWVECDELVQEFDWESWEEWVKAITGRDS